MGFNDFILDMLRKVVSLGVVVGEIVLSERFIWQYINARWTSLVLYEMCKVAWIPWRGLHLFGVRVVGGI